MTKAQDAYEEAQQRIVKNGDSTTLDLAIKDLEVIPPEIATLTNLTQLDLTNTRITSVEPLTTLTNLTQLVLNSTQVTSVEPLAALTGLTELSLNDTQVTSVEPLAALTGLTELYLNDTQVTSVEPLAALTGLTELYLNDTQVTSVEPLAALTGLTELSLRNTQVTSVEPLAALTGLTRLDLNDTQVTSVEPLAALTGLTELYLNDTQVTSVEPLAALTGLTELSLRNTQVTSVEPLAALTGLTELSLRNTQVTSVEPLAALTGLTRLDLDNTQVTSVEPLAALTGLTELYLNDTQVTSVEPLAALTGLTELSLRNTQVTSVEPLAALTGLTRLYLDNTQVTSVEPLAALTGLTELSLRNTQVTSVEPLAALTGLTRLYLDNTQVTDLRPIKGLGELASGGMFTGLYFKNCRATNLDRKLQAFSEIEDSQERTQKTLDYLNELTEWPPSEAMPEENPDAPRYLVPDDGPVTESGAPLGPNDPEQQALQDECREKVRTLIASVREGDNELAPLVDAASKYSDLIDQNSPDILASSLWSAANTLRSKHEAHKRAVDQGRINEELPPMTATTLQDLLETHGIFFLGHPGAAEVERKMREFLNGARNPEAQKIADRIADTLTDAPSVLTPEAADPMSLDQQASSGSGPSAQMAESSLQNRLQNFIAVIARKVWTFSKTKTGLAIDTVIAADILSWLAGNKLLIVQFYEAITTQYPVWLDAIMQLISKIPL